MDGPSPIVADSGNGYHLLYSVDFANTNENRELLKKLLADTRSIVF